ncbi:AMP-binding protein, partial [Streptococcus pneumoniae]
PNTDIKIIKDDGSDAKIGEAGELWVKGDQVMRGYWQRPEATSEVLKDGWMATGDIVLMDESYSLRIVD